MSVQSTPASALRQLHFTATPWTERSATGAVATPAERRLTAQVARAESTLRDVHGELEERTRLLARARKPSIRFSVTCSARDSESSSRELARERHDADTRRVAELERQWPKRERRDAREVGVRRSSARPLWARAGGPRAGTRSTRGRARAPRGAARETHREDAARRRAPSSGSGSPSRKRARRSRQTRARRRDVSAERAERAEAVRLLVASATELRETERLLREENGTLKEALRRAAEKHEEAMASVSRTNMAATRPQRLGDDSAGAPPDALASRLAKLQTDMKALAERESASWPGRRP